MSERKECKNIIGKTVAKIGVDQSNSDELYTAIQTITFTDGSSLILDTRDPPDDHWNDKSPVYAEFYTKDAE